MPASWCFWAAALVFSSTSDALAGSLPSCKAPAPPPPPPPGPSPGPTPHPDPSRYQKKTVLATNVTLYWGLARESSNVEVEFLLHWADPTVGWIATGFGPAAAMANSSFVIGYPGCVRVTSLVGNDADQPPNGPAGFSISSASFSRDDSGAWLAYNRPPHDSLPGHVSLTKDEQLHVLYAAGTVAPETCSEEFEMADIHNIGHGVTIVPTSQLFIENENLQPQQTKGMQFSKDGVESFVRSEKHPRTGREYAVFKQTIFSEPLYLANGDVVFTPEERTIIPMPDGDYNIHSIVGEVVDCNNISVPLSVVYNHHWILKPISGPTKHTNIPCDGQSFAYVFGVGAESRTTPTVFPPGYGYPVKSGTVWGANIHLLHTEDIVGGQQGIKECIECWATPYRISQGHGCTAEHGNGSFTCCGSGGGGKCEVNNADPVPTRYAMRMVVEFSRDVRVDPVDTATFLSPNCQYEYNTGDENTEQVGDVNIAWTVWQIKSPMEFIFGVGHIHTGAINMSVSVQRAGQSNYEFVCASHPIYGSGGAIAGNESGHLVQVTFCLSSDGNDGGMPSKYRSSFLNGSLVLNPGDSLKVQGYYNSGDDPRIAPTPGGPHLGIMSYFYGAYKSGGSKRIELIPRIQK